MNEIYELPLFEGISQDEMRWLLDHSYEMFLDRGEFFVQVNEPADRFYVVLEGELQITRTINKQEMVLGTTPRGIIGGEVALLHGTPSDMSVRAIVPSHLLVFEQQAFFALFATCPMVGSRILRTATERMHQFAAMLQQQEKMAALGKLSAGLAHELNNPAAAVRRAACTLQEMLPDLQTRTMKLTTMCPSAGLMQQLLAFQQQMVTRLGTIPPLPPMEQSDREEEMVNWSVLREVANPWEVAACFVAFGVTLPELQQLTADIPTEHTTDVLAWLYASLQSHSLLQEIDHSSTRISDIVSAVKGYTYMDQGAMQNVDIHKGLENTLTMLNHRLKEITIIRQYDTDLPMVQARGSELNQVWTNLLDNALDAMQEQGTIWLVTRCENDYVMVEIADDGPGIPQDIQPRLFDPFFTTKDVGVGTGLGLDISYRIIQDHHGTIEVQSQPGLTRFIVRLPVHCGERAC